MVCQTIPNPDAFVSGTIAFLDYQAQTIGMIGYRALAAPGSSASLVLAAFVTIFIALIGYRMLFGETPSLREAVLSVVKIGVVLALATGWSGYRILVYDVALRAPAELASEIGGASGLPGASGGLPARLDGADRAFETLAVYGVGIPKSDPAAAAVAPDRYAPPLFAGFDTFAIGGARTVFLASAIGGFALVRLAAGLLLALGPLFLAFLLFDATRGLFEGWARALIATALGSLATAILLGVELALLEPWLAELIARRSGGEAIWGTPTPLLATTCLFAMVLGGLLVMTAWIGFALRLPDAWRSIALPIGAARPGDGVRSIASVDASATTIDAASRSRALVIADGIAATQRREEQLAGASGAGGVTTVVAANGAQSDRSLDPRADTALRLGQSYRRRTGARISASAGARDRRA